MRGKIKTIKNGFSIIEVMVAIGVILVSFIGMLTLINRSLIFHDLAYSRLIASYLAQEGIEIVRNIRDNNILQNKNWNEGLSAGTYQVQYDDLSLRPYTGEPLKLDTANGIYNYDSGALTRYIRQINIDPISPDHIRVQSIVTWTNRGGSFNIVVEDHLYNWLSD
ncbi:MAG: type IV pilus modification PilV family protein [Minisyncoccia bacterium]